MSVKSVNIQPGVSVLSVLRHLNYRPWFALGEFVDNALQSFLAHRDKLKALHGEDVRLAVSIDIDSTKPGRIAIRDNAAGIDERNYKRAFRPAAIPPDRSGLSEFGMGMKSAACWFSPRWHVRTSALGEPFERLVSFDIERIVNDDIGELGVEEQLTEADAHFTEVVLEDLHHPPVKRTVGKIKDHLTDIYRLFLRDGTMVLTFNGEPLTHVMPKILRAAHFRNESGPPVLWRKDIDFDFGGGMRVQGFAALRETASVSTAGFALFRRKRLIQGSADEGYRPEFIFGKPNSYCYQRLFGELHLHGIEVAQTKDGIRWDESEQPFLQLLREHLDADDMPLIRQANGYRARSSRAVLQKAIESAVTGTADTMKRTLEPVVQVIAEQPPTDSPPPEELPREGTAAGEREIEINFRGTRWRIVIELRDDPAIGEWLEVGDAASLPQHNQPRTLRLRLSLSHPFMVRFAGADGGSIEPLLRVAAALGLAEVLAREAGVRQAGTVRRNANELLRKSLSEP